jgi:hypothetical protein
MESLTISSGELIAEYDNTIKKTLHNLLEKEQNLINQYTQLNNLKQNCNEKTINKLNNLLDERRLFIEYKMLSKIQQKESLYKILEYLNTLEDKKKLLDIEEINKQVSQIDIELIPYNNVNF